MIGEGRYGEWAEREKNRGKTLHLLFFSSVQHQCSHVTSYFLCFLESNPEHIPFAGDTRLFEVKLADLPAWFARREKTPGAFYNEVMRNIWRVHNKYYSGPVYANTVKTIFRFIFCYSFLCWLVKSHRYIEFQKTMYHWQMEAVYQRCLEFPGQTRFVFTESQRDCFTLCSYDKQMSCRDEKKNTAKGSKPREEYLVCTR